MIQTIRKFILGSLILTMAIAALPITSAFAAGAIDPVTPPVSGTAKDPVRVKARLELVFARQQFKVQRISLAIDKSDALFKQLQALIDRAVKNGKDASAVQVAFDAYKVAFETAKTFYQQAKTTVSAHAGFDAIGKVTDTEKAKATVKSLNESLKQYRDTISGPLKNLHEAVKTFRAANPHPTSTPKAP